MAKGYKTADQVYFSQVRPRLIAAEKSAPKGLEGTVQEIDKNEHAEAENSVLVCDKEYWRKVAYAACKRFPEQQISYLGRKESIHSKEISQRLSKLRELGYELEPYGKMNKEEKWRYLMRIRAEVYERIQRDYPGIYKEIQDFNSRQQSGFLD